jgi:hypothetical protein
MVSVFSIFFSILASFNPARSPLLPRIFSDPLLTESGSLTEDRDYETYVQGMSNPDIMQLKANEVVPFVVEGRCRKEVAAVGGWWFLLVAGV